MRKKAAALVGAEGDASSLAGEKQGEWRREEPWHAQGETTKMRQREVVECRLLGLVQVRSQEFAKAVKVPRASQGSTNGLQGTHQLEKCRRRRRQLAAYRVPQRAPATRDRKIAAAR